MDGDGAHASLGVAHRRGRVTVTTEPPLHHTEEGGAGCQGSSLRLVQVQVSSEEFDPLVPGLGCHLPVTGLGDPRSCYPQRKSHFPRVGAVVLCFNGVLGTGTLGHIHPAVLTLSLCRSKAQAGAWNQCRLQSGEDWGPLSNPNLLSHLCELRVSAPSCKT